MTTSSPESALERPFRFRVASADLVVRSLRGVERLSRPFEFHVACVWGDGELNADQLLGAAATLTLVGPRGVLRVVRGIAGRVQTSGWGGRGAAVEVRVVPRLWTLGRGRRSRVFQEKSVPDIVRQVLGENAIDCEVSTSRAYAPRTYCVQYQESDLAFVSRIAAEEGLFYFFRQPSAGSDAKEVVVFGDAPTHFESIAGEKKLPMQHGGALSTSEHVSSLASTEAVRSGKALVRAYEQERPLYDVRGEASSSRGALDETTLLTYRHDADALEGVDDGVATRLLDARRRRASTAAGSSTCLALSPGLTFEVEGHVVEALNAGYTLVRVEHEGNQPVEAGDGAGGPSYANRFECVAATARWRPKKPLRKLQQTTETAVVVGPPGEEIHVDAEGRVKVQFPWDLEGKHDEASSCWLRTMQPWAGANWGSQFIPRVGMEVVVLFVAGDVDRPLIAGSVANGVNPMPFSLPAHKTQSGIRTRSTPGGDGSNELRFDDAASAEQIYLHAQKDLDVLVEHDHSRKVGHSEAIRVADDRLVDVGGSQKRTVAKGDELHVGNTRAMEIGGDHVRVVNGNEIVEIGKNLIVHVKGKHIFKIGGKSEDGSEPEQDVAPPAPPELASRPEPPPGPSAREVVDSAQLLWAVEQLPAAQYADGAAIQTLVEDLAPHLGSLTGEASGLLRLIGAAPRLLAPSMARAAEDVLVRATQFRDALGQVDKVIGSHGAGDGEDPLSDVRSSASRVVAGYRRRVDEAEQMSHATVAAAKDFAAHGGGSAHGGGGATPTWKTDKNSSVLKITGAGVIQSDKSLTLKCQGSYIKLEPAAITVQGATVTLQNGQIFLGGKKIEIKAPTVTIEDTTIAIDGTNITLNASGLAKIVGAPITLN